MSSVSAKAFIAVVLLLVLQIFPVTGIFLWMAGAPMIVGLLTHLLLVSLGVEAYLRRIPRWFIVIPFVVYGSYYAVYVQQGFSIASREAALQARNPGQLMLFDHTTHDLALERAGGFVQYHRIPVAYTPNPNVPEKYRAERLLTLVDCRTVPKDSQSRVGTHGASYDRDIKSLLLSKAQGLCILSVPERPSKPLVSVTSTDEQIWKKRTTISEAEYTVTVEGKALGSFITASVYRLSPIPFFVAGCGLRPSGWKCGVAPKKSLRRLQTIPASVDQVEFSHPISIMLGIPKYTTEELVHFTPAPENEVALSHVQGEAGRVEDGVFADLERMFVDPQMKPPHNMGFSLALNGGRLVEKAEAMVAFFEDLHGPDFRTFAHWPQKRRDLARAITALPPATFDQYVARIFPLIQGDRRWNDYPGLYVRVADMRGDAVAFYQEQYETHVIGGWLKFLPVLAFCRIGEVENGLLNQLKVEFRDLDPKGSNNGRYHQALFVTLLRLGEREFVRAHYRQKTLRKERWYEQVLEGTVETKYQSDACAIADWGILHDH